MPVIIQIAKKFLWEVAIGFGVSILTSAVFGNGESNRVPPPYYSSSHHNTAVNSTPSHRPPNWTDNPYEKDYQERLKNYVNSLQLEVVNEPCRKEDLRIGYYSGMINGKRATLEISDIYSEGSNTFFKYMILTSEPGEDIKHEGRFNWGEGTMDFDIHGIGQINLVKMRLHGSHVKQLFLNSQNQQFQFIYHETA